MWIFENNTYLYGNMITGCGVYFENGKYYYNIVVNGDPKVIGDFASSVLTEAKEIALQGLLYWENIND